MEIVFSLPRSRLVLGLVGMFILSLAFGLAVYFIVITEGPLWLVLMVSSISLATLACVVRSICQFRHTERAVVIDDAGLSLNVGFNAFGLIPWTDIEDFSEGRTRHAPYVLIQVKDPKAYLRRLRNPVSRFMVIPDYWLFGTPLILSPAFLDVDESYLLSLLKALLRQRQSHREDRAQTHDRV